MKILYVTKDSPPPRRIWTADFGEALTHEGFEVENLATEGIAKEDFLTILRGREVVLTSWGSPMLPAELAADPGCLRYFCHITGAVRDYPEEILDSPVAVTNRGGSAGPSVAEGTPALLLACLKNLRAQIEDKLDGKWVCDGAGSSGSLRVPQARPLWIRPHRPTFHRYVQPLGPDIRIYDPYSAGIPSDCRRVSSLRELFADSEAVVIFAALTEETRGSVDCGVLALLPDHAVIVNTARGDIINQDDLFAELAAGRLRAGLDVLAGPDCLEPGHPAIGFKNPILTSHRVGDSSWQTPISSDSKRLQFYRKTCIENLIRHREGKPLEHVTTRERYARMTWRRDGRLSRGTRAEFR